MNDDKTAPISDLDTLLRNSIIDDPLWRLWTSLGEDILKLSAAEIKAENNEDGLDWNDPTSNGRRAQAICLHRLKIPFDPS